MEMVCRFVVPELVFACTISGKLFEPPPPPPPLLAEPPQDVIPVATAASNRLNAAARAKASAL